MREIKFRARDKITKEILEGLNLQGMFAHYENGSCILEQFIGLYDRNKKEVYEGDILQSLNYKNEPGEKFVIESKMYNNCGCCSNVYGWNIDDSTDECEVIGNIYENPELLIKEGGAGSVGQPVKIITEFNEEVL